MQQVMFNLIENGLRYSQAQTQQASIQLVAGLANHNQQAYSDIIDQGPGIDVAIKDRIFEPFFTTDHSGTGLGLYISKELCECNQARLEAIAPFQGGCFRITFAHPDALGTEQHYE